jgi:hypothetical protein
MPLWRREDDWTVALDDNEREIIRAPLRDPVHIREAFDEQYQVVRTSCP